MEKLKDFFYDKNDIFVAAIILIIAAIIILWRVDVITTYPETLVASSAENGESTENGSDAGEGDATDAGEGTETADGNAENGAEGEATVCAVYVNYGDSLDTIANNCVTAGLISSKDEFISAVNSANAATSIKAGQHYIPSNVTPSELIDYLTQTGL